MFCLPRPELRGGLARFLPRAAARIVLYFKKIFDGGPQTYIGAGIVNLRGTEPAEL